MQARAAAAAFILLIASLNIIGAEIVFRDHVFISQFTSNDPRSAIVTDINGDAAPDVVYCSADGIHYALQDADALGSFDPPAILQAGTEGDAFDACTAIEAMYWDDDNLIDLVYGSADTSGSLMWARGTGSLPNLFTRPLNAVIADNLGDPPRKIFEGNFNGDDKADVAMISGDGSSWIANGEEEIHDIPNSDATDLVVVDVNNDGLDDIVTLWGGAEAEFLQNSNGVFRQEASSSLGTAEQTGSATVADLNGDGILDGIVADDATRNGAGGSVKYSIGAEVAAGEPPSFDTTGGDTIFNVPWPDDPQSAYGPVREVRAANARPGARGASVFLLTTDRLYVAENVRVDTDADEHAWELQIFEFLNTDEDLFLSLSLVDVNQDGFVDVVIASPANEWVVYIEQDPTNAPTPSATDAQTSMSTAAPTPVPTESPTSAVQTSPPTSMPSAAPSAAPTSLPTPLPTDTPTSDPMTGLPTRLPTPAETPAMPTDTPTSAPTGVPTVMPTPLETPPPQPEPNVPDIVFLGRSPQQIPNEGGSFSLAVQHVDPNFRVRVHWGDAGDLFRTDEVLMYYGNGSDVNASASLLQISSEMHSSYVAYQNDNVEILQSEDNDGGIVSFGDEECDALCGGVPQGDDSAACKCFRFEIPPNPQNQTSPDYLDGLTVYISFLNLDNFQRVLSPPYFLKYDALFCSDAFWQPDPSSPRCEPCPACGFCPGGHRVWPLQGCWSPDEMTVPTSCRVAEACKGIDPNEPVCERQASATCVPTAENPCVCLEVATARCSVGYADRLCSSCAGNFYGDGMGQCLQCTGTPTAEQRRGEVAALIVVAFFYLLFISMALVFLGDRKLGTFVATLVGLQQFSHIASNASAFMEGLSESMRVSLSRLALLNFQVEFFRPECLVESFDWIDFFWATIAFMAVAVAMFITAAYLRKHYLHFEVKHNLEERLMKTLDRWYAVVVVQGILQCCGRRRAPKARQLNYLQRQPTVPNVDASARKGDVALQRVSTVRDTDIVSIQKPEEKPDSSMLAHLYFTPSRLHEKIFKYRAIHSFCILGSIIYLQITQRALAGIHCVAGGMNGAQVLQVEQSIECFQSKHLVASVFIVALLIFYSIAFPIWTLRILLRLRQKGFDSYHSSEKYGFLYRGLKKRYLLFRWLFFPLSFALALQNTFADHSSTQLFVGCVVFISYVLVVATVWPFRNWYNNMSYLVVGVGALVQLMIFLNIGRGGLSCFGIETEESAEAAGLLTSVSVCRDTESFALLILVAVFVVGGFFLIFVVNLRRRLKTGRWLPPSHDDESDAAKGRICRQHDRHPTIMSLNSESDFAVKPIADRSSPSDSPNVTQRSPVPMQILAGGAYTPSSSAVPLSPTAASAGVPYTPTAASRAVPYTPTAASTTVPLSPTAASIAMRHQSFSAASTTVPFTPTAAPTAVPLTPTAASIAMRHQSFSASKTPSRIATSAWGAGSVKILDPEFIPVSRVNTSTTTEV